MNLERRIGLLKKLGEYIVSDEENWANAREKAAYENGWFVEPFIDFQLKHLADHYLSENKLQAWLSQYGSAGTDNNNKQVGIVMAGNIPLAGFHDFLSAFVAGKKQRIKPSSKDTVLISAIVNTLTEWEPAMAEYVEFANQLKNCDAYIATGSNNSARYFDYYFSKYPHIIRKNRTSVAILSGSETAEDLAKLADDVHLYFGLGCRNVTKLYVPRDYDFVPLLEAFRTYNWLFDNHKYKNNYDYQLAIMIINNLYYMTNGSVLLREENSLFSPISQLNYEFYDNVDAVKQFVTDNLEIQCVVGSGYTPFGEAQTPSLSDYSDKMDTLKFLLEL